MGVKAFFKWLTVRYPKVVIDALSENDIEVLEDLFKVDQSKVQEEETKDYGLDQSAQSEKAERK